MWTQAIADFSINNIKNNAQYAKCELDTSLRVHPDFVNRNLAHIQDCIENPTRGLIARRLMRKSELNAPKYYRNNLKEYMDFPAVKEKLSEFNEKFYSKSLYYKTGYFRKRLINQDRIVFGKVLRRSKLNHILIKYTYCAENFISKLIKFIK